MMTFQRFALYVLVSLQANLCHADTLNTSPQEASTPPLKIGMHNMGEPLAYIDQGVVSGIFPELVQSIGELSGVNIEIQLLPYQRIFTQATWQQQDLGLTFQPNRKSVSEIPLKLACFDKPLFRSRLKIYGIKKSVKDKPIMASLVPAQLNKSKHLLAEIGGTSLQVIERNSVEALFKSLLSSRVDYIASSELATYYWRQKLQAPPIHAFARLADVEGILCHPKKKNTKESISQLASYINSIDDQSFSEMVEPILKAYDFPDSFLSPFLPLANNN